MLDHVFTDAIGALRDAMEDALLERLAMEEQFQNDVLLGDLSWETSYGVPGEGRPPKVRADVSLYWSTWSQAAFRSWYLAEELPDHPSIDIEIGLRIQRLRTSPDPHVVFAALPEESPPVGHESLERSGPTVETLYDVDLSPLEHAIEVTYEGVYELDEETLADGSRLDEDFKAMGGWIASLLVRLGDLDLEFVPPSERS